MLLFLYLAINIKYIILNKLFSDLTAALVCVQKKLLRMDVAPRCGFHTMSKTYSDSLHRVTVVFIAFYIERLVVLRVRYRLCIIIQYTESLNNYTFYGRRIYISFFIRVIITLLQYYYRIYIYNIYSTR